MNKDILFALIAKEIRQVLRNKRVIVGLLLPLLLYPVLFNVYSSVMENAEASAKENISTLMVVGQLPEELEEALIEDAYISLSPMSLSLDKIRDKTFDGGLAYSYQDQQHLFKFYGDSGRSATRKVYERLMVHVDAFESRVQESYLNDNSVELNILNPSRIERQDIANQSEKSGKSLGDIIPMILTISALLSVVNFAIEMTTGEKEAGTLETLFSVPISRMELVLSKLISCIGLGLVAMVINLSALVILLPSIIQEQNLAFRVDIMTIGILMMTLLPLILMGAGASLGVGMFANSYKESGAYITPLTFLFMVPAYVGMIPGIALNEVLASIPVVNSTLLIKSVFLGTFDMTYFSISFVSNMIFSIVSLIFMFRVFGAERILFASGKSFSFKIRRKDILKKDLIEPQDAVLLVVIAIIIFIYVGSVTSNLLGIVKGTLFIQYTAFAIVPLFLTWYMKADLKKSIGLKKPKVSPSIAGVFLWIGALSLMLVYQLLVSDVVTEVPTMVGVEQIFDEMSMLQQFLFIAFTPGICEELLFRGLAFRPIEKKLGPKKAILITALLFGIMHLDIVRLLPTVLLGLVMGTVAYASGSIFPVMLLHICNNFFAAFGLADLDVSMGLLVIVGISGLSLGGILIKKSFDREQKEDYNRSVK